MMKLLGSTKSNKTKNENGKNAQNGKNFLVNLQKTKIYGTKLLMI